MYTYRPKCFVTSSKMYDNNYDVRSVNCEK